MKNLKYILLGLCSVGLIQLATSCSKMMEVDSTNQAFDPELDSKTDSVFYAFGIAQAMQQLADQYFFQGEMRGELVSTTDYTDNNLRQLKNFSATTENKYDSAYVYYRVINNCNYYLQHRNTSLMVGSTNVTTNEYAAVLAYRAWAYLQLVRNYGKVPFFTEALTTISQIDNNNFPEYGISEITSALAPELSKYSGVPVPNYGTAVECGSTNFGVKKTMNTSRTFIPVDVILGDLYLENGEYENAANSFVTYLTKTGGVAPRLAASFKLRNDEDQAPSDAQSYVTGTSYTNIFGQNSVADIITYIPMSVNRVRGTVTGVPYAFGFDYYALSNSDCWQENVQLAKSKEYSDLTDNLEYYYYKEVPGANDYENVASGKYGDMRSLAIMRTRYSTASGIREEKEWIDKFQSGNIILYRNTTVWLHLAEALNRMGMPDYSFAILKEGLSAHLVDSTNTWLSDKSKALIKSTFLSDVYYETFYKKSFPIHQHGCGVTSDGDYPGSSPYQFASEIGKKLKTLSSNATLYPNLSARLASSTAYNEAVAQAAAQQKALLEAGDSTTIVPVPSPTAYGTLLAKSDTIMAMEELLCDEEAMEFCFEGSRWYDLMRFAKHKNAAGLDGGAWLADKIKQNAPTKDVSNVSNWYLPFK